MKGIILAGGHGTRLLPLTATTSKQLLPVYDRQMIFYPLNTLIKAGITEILIIVAPEHSGQFLNLLGDIFSRFGIQVSFMVQRRPRGLAEAFILGEDFLDGGPVAMVLGDNIFEDDFTEAISTFSSGGRVFAVKVPDPERFGVVEFDEKGRALSVEEKPSRPKSSYAIPGIYLYDGRVCEIAKGLTPSDRGELEVTDITRFYLEQGELEVHVLQGKWFDAGTFDSLLEAGNFVKEAKILDRFDPKVNEAVEVFRKEFKRSLV